MTTMPHPTFALSSMKQALEAFTNAASTRLITEAMHDANLLPLPHAAPSPNLIEVNCSSDKALENNYQSSAVLMRRLAESIMEWRRQLPEGVQPAVMAILNGGLQIRVHRLAQESFHGIRIEGTLNGSPCMLLAHQATVQMLCYVEKIDQNTPASKPRKIGFIIEGEEREV
ncbi:MAG: hypothetical protein WAQ53_04245 [Thiofilum sp.]|uniref:hypothetical protein n=1 Tax=Thiofilum sp. TaxID=2212733 RepID=UPI0025E7A985|nr:hypothetical protein [Thiofilum sp.]MBK8454901.1 hypothetical protein [Thiofilum sp.]